MKNPAWGAVIGFGIACVIFRVTGFGVGNGIAGPFAIGFLLAGAVCGVGLRRALRGGMSGFWQTNVGRWIIGRMAGGIVYTMLAAMLWKPAEYAIADAAIGLVYLIGWQAFSVIAPVFPWLIKGFALGGAWYLRTPAKVFIGKSSAPLRREYRKIRMGCGGSAAFAGIFEEWANRWRPGMIFFGHSLFDRHWPIGIKDERMLLTLAGTGAGKGESAIVNNVLLHDGSMFINDPSGQIASITAAPLRAKGFEVQIIDQMNVLGQGTARLDPLAELDPEAKDYVIRLKQLVEAMSISSGSGRNRYFEENGKTLLRGAIDYLKRRKGAEFVERAEYKEAADD